MRVVGGWGYMCPHAIIMGSQDSPLDDPRNTRSSRSSEVGQGSHGMGRRIRCSLRPSCTWALIHGVGSGTLAGQSAV